MRWVDWNMLKDQNLGIYQVAHVLPDTAIYTGIVAESWHIDLWWFKGLITSDVCLISFASRIDELLPFGVGNCHRQNSSHCTLKRILNPNNKMIGIYFLSNHGLESCLNPGGHRNSLRSNWTKSCWMCWLWQLYLPILGGSWSIMISCCRS